MRKPVRFVLLVLFSAPLLLSDYPFQANVKISTDAYGNVNHGESSFIVRGDTVYALCNIAERPVIPMIPFSRSVAEGDTWDLDYAFVDSSINETWHTDPVVGVDDSGHVHMLVQFNMYYIYHYLSRDGGITWAETTIISDSSTGGYVDKPWMVVRGNKVYVSWQEFQGSADGVRFARSDDYGRHFWRTTVDDMRTGLTALNVGDDGTIYLAYVYDGMYFRYSTDDGNSWSGYQYIDDVYYSSGVGDRAPINSLAVSPTGELLISWVDDRYGTWDILGARSTDGGQTWEGPYVLNDVTAGGQCKGWVTYDPYGKLHLFYYSTPDWPTDTLSLWSIKYQLSSDFGNSFGPSIEITDTVFRGHFYDDRLDFMGDYHMILADSNYLYAVWADGRDGDMDLFFSKAPLELLNLAERDNLSVTALRLDFITGKNPALKLELPTGSDLVIDAYDPSGRFLGSVFSGWLTRGTHIVPLEISGPSRVVLLRVKGANTKTVKGLILR